MKQPEQQPAVQQLQLPTVTSCSGCMSLCGCAVCCWRVVLQWKTGVNTRGRETPIVRPKENPVPSTLASTPDGPRLPPVSNARPTVAFTGPAEAEALASSALAMALTPTALEISAPALALGPLASASK
ncbi:hypothetical protein FQN60_002432 [Etheostoma spectabile]|uniref:Uncharacterized protein n=1 Tax=Etheostoma spectabile TaxID=54343 RepID=A0A5J5DCE5_9PERO|nr:hypothetical protein FQN60_002432 [Etheostoma spectabile]